MLRWLRSTPRRTFILYPMVIALFEFASRRGAPAFRPWGAVFLVCGYLQYRLTDAYRLRNGGAALF